MGAAVAKSVLEQMATHVFDLTGVELPTSEAQPLEEISVRWAQAESVLLNLAASFPFKSSAAQRSTANEERTIRSRRSGVAGSRRPVSHTRRTNSRGRIHGVPGQGDRRGYVSPQIEEMLGFSQEEWLNDPVRWYNKFILPTKVAGALKRRGCFSQDSR